VILMVVLGLLVMQQAPARDTRAGTTADAPGRIVGMVTSDEPRPRPLRRARVTLLGSGSDHFDAVVTGDDGRFAFDRLPPGRYTLTAIKAAYVTMS
jgi:hypothetical protein